MPISEREQARLEAMSEWEKHLKEKGFFRIAGLDEAGRGPLAGPVVAAACILPEGALFEHLNDSKQLSLERREHLFAKLTAHLGVHYGVGQASVLEIDRYNILQATLIAMRRAIRALSALPDFLLVDGNALPSPEFPSQALIGGDRRSVSIAAASILAKVTRDRLMSEYHEKWPFYGFAQHKGYATEQHLRALKERGPCPLHRKSFQPIRSLV